MSEPAIPTELTPGAERLAAAAAARQERSGHPGLGTHHWLAVLLERHGAMAEELAGTLNAAASARQVEARLAGADTGTPLTREAVLEAAGRHALARGRQRVAERDLAVAILSAAGYSLQGGAAAPGKPMPEAAHTGTYTPRSRRPTPMLEQFGRDLTRAAVEGRLPPLVGRTGEVQLVIETLCRRTKRNPVLVGPAGVGKTAIVEGLAARIVAGQVPAALHGLRVIAVQPSSLVAGASVFGEVEKRMKAVLAEASQDGLVLFIDEVHSIIGAGGHQGTGDFASLLKPALSRGDLACIAATTDDEYRRFIEPDTALERRFQPIRVQELSAAQTLEVLQVLRQELARHQGVAVPDSVLATLVEYAQEFLRNRHFPDKAVDLLEQVVAHALTEGHTEVSHADAEAVAQRMVGMPLALGERLGALRETLLERALLPPNQCEQLRSRLEITLRGLDLRPSRPSAVALLTAEAARSSLALAEAIAETLFGSPERVVVVDFSRFAQPHDVSMLLGAPPGYVGYQERLPLDAVAQMPWCVLLCESVDAAHPAVREVLRQALEDGILTDARGKRTYLSDAVVLLTAESETHAQRRLGFADPHGGDHGRDEGPREAELRSLLAEAVGRELVALSDLVTAGVPHSTEAQRRWLRQRLLGDLAERYRRQGVVLEWEESVVDWLMELRSQSEGRASWERLVDERLSPELIRHLPETPGGPPRNLRVGTSGGGVCVTAAG